MLFRSVAQRLARGAHNSEVRCSNHLAGIIPICLFYRNWPSSWTLNAVNFIPVWRRGSALLNTVFYQLYHLWYDLRMVMAYNPEDVGSKPTTGIHFFLMKFSFH